MNDAGDFFVIVGRKHPKFWLVGDIFRSRGVAEETLRQLSIDGIVRRISISYEFVVD